MRKIDGTVTISIEEFEELREYEQWFNELRRMVKGLVKEIDTEQYDSKMEKIGEICDPWDEEFDRLRKEAERTLKIIISEKMLKKLVQEYIDGEKNEVLYIIGDMTQEEIDKILIVLDGEQEISDIKSEEKESKMCEMCEAYMADTECDLVDSCPAAGIVKELQTFKKAFAELTEDSQKTIKEKDRVIEEASKEIKRLKGKVDKLNLEKSYMVNPNAIGDRHEMGG